MKEKHEKMTDLLSLLTFAVFALCVLGVLLTGAKVYRNLVTGGNESYAYRTALRYVTTRVRQAESLTVEDFGGCSALVLRETIDGESYLTRVYSHEGDLRELFCAESASLSPEDGEKVFSVEELSFSLEDGMLTAVVNGRELKLYIPRGKEIGP